jgi:hypothetical protein
MWKGEPGRLQKARVQGWQKQIEGKPVSAHSIMLSAYISIAGSKEYNPILHPILMLWHAFWLRIQWQELDHNELDILVQFLLKVRRVSHFWPSKRLAKMSARERYLAQRWGTKPNQIALASVTHAEVICAVDFVGSTILACIDEALALEDQIRSEPDQPQGLRQLVRIFRKIGELYFELYKINHDPTEYSHAVYYADKALGLARGEADCADQIPKIEAVLNRMGPR